MQELTKVEQQSAALSANDVKAQVSLIQDVLKTVMVRGSHYDVVQGCGDKPVLLKPGAEKIMATFRLGAEPKMECLRDSEHVRYSFIVRIFSIISGATVGYGVGTASSEEKKYAWRGAVCKAEYDDTPENRRKKLWKSDGSCTLQVRQNPADLENTIMKMAKKRALVDGCLTCTACSDIFAQDIDDPDAPRNESPAKYSSPRKSTQSATAATSSNGGELLISPAQARRLYAIAKSKNMADDEIAAIVSRVAGVDRTTSIPAAKYEETVAAIERAAGGATESGDRPGESALKNEDMPF